MHCVNINLSNLLNDCYQLLPSNLSLHTQFTHTVQQAHPEWKPAKTLEPNQTKLFFKRGYQDQLTAIFKHLKVSYGIPWPNKPVHEILPAHQLIASLREFWLRKLSGSI